MKMLTKTGGGPTEILSPSEVKGKRPTSLAVTRQRKKLERLLSKKYSVRSGAGIETGWDLARFLGSVVFNYVVRPIRGARIDYNFMKLNHFMNEADKSRHFNMYGAASIGLFVKCILYLNVLDDVGAIDALTDVYHSGLSGML